MLLHQRQGPRRVVDQVRDLGDLELAALGPVRPDQTASGEEGHHAEGHQAVLADELLAHRVVLEAAEHAARLADRAVGLEQGAQGGDGLLALARGHECLAGVEDPGGALLDQLGGQHAQTDVEACEGAGRLAAGGHAQECCGAAGVVVLAQVASGLEQVAQAGQLLVLLPAELGAQAVHLDDRVRALEAAELAPVLGLGLGVPQGVVQAAQEDAALAGRHQVEQGSHAVGAELGGEQGRIALAQGPGGGGLDPGHQPRRRAGDVALGQLPLGQDQQRAVLREA